MRVTALGISLMVLTISAVAAAQDATYPGCTYPSLASHDVTLVITVKPAAGMEWKFPEAPSVVADRILDGLKQNSQWKAKDNWTHNIDFKEASGTEPSFRINVTVSETNEGTRQDSMEAVVEGPKHYQAFACGTAQFEQCNEFIRQFSERSGDFAFTNWRDAADELSKRLVIWFRSGWIREPPCWEFDGKKWYIRRN
jgi:hypothetical protein